jgi:heterogeneous nuclear ribonucleoprotein U-like protein 1
MKTDYSFPQSISLNDRIRSSEPIPEKNDCQVLLLSGLNGSGKTTWAKKYIAENPMKHFELINVESVLNKMAVGFKILQLKKIIFLLKIDGKLPSIKDRNDGLMLRVNVCLQKLIEIAAQRRRNFIIDHVRFYLGIVG